MLINRIQEGESGDGREREGEYDQEYRTASELFDIMAKNHSFDGSEADSLTTSDLVLLYKNLDLGTQLMSRELQVKKPNQYVESVVHKEGDDSDSELSEIYSSEDLRDVILFNNEQIDMINNPPSLEHILCQKIGDLKLETAEHSSPYDKYFLLKDPYVRDKLNNLNSLNDANFKIIETVFPSSLLDYICCKRLEDNFNFYMDSVIRYVIHTIEQLKRISNGDFLTEKAKEKWRGVNDAHGTNCLNFLCTSKSIPIQIERKKTNQISKKRNVMRSEIDIRSLSKLLEKKIVIEIPRLINGSFTLFSKRFDDNLFITCKKKADKEEEQRVELVLKLDKSESGMITSKISSIKILQTSTITNQLESPAVKPLALTYVISDEENESDKTVIEKNPFPPEDIVSNYLQTDSFNASDSCQGSSTNSYQKEIIDSTSMSVIETPVLAEDTTTDDYDVSLDTTFKGSQKDLKPVTISSPEELRLTVQKLEVEKILPEEIWQEDSNKKKTLGKIRIKSPYENKSSVMEEKRRKKLLEIRQRREIRKQAHAENMKISKQKYGKPHSTNSVTKLSITNKSFYNSIYGQASLYSDKMKKVKNNNEPFNTSSKLLIDLTAEQNGNLKEATEKDHRKYTDRTFFLDDTISDVMVRQQDEKEVNDNNCVTPTVNPNIVIQVIEKDCPAEDLLVDHKFKDNLLMDIDPPNLQNITDSIQAKLNSAKSSTVLAPSNSPKNSNTNDRTRESKKNTTVEFKESIEKIYDLMKHIENQNGKENLRYFEDDESSIPPANEGANSANCYLRSSTLNSKSLTRVHENRETNKKSLETIMPISHKTPGINRALMARLDGDNLRNERKKKLKLKNNFDSENPLKAISMLIREFDDVSKPKSAQAKLNQPKMSQSTHYNTNSTFRSPRRSPTKMEIRMNESISPIERSGRKVNERRPRASTLAEGLKTNEAMLAHTDRRSRRKVSDIIEQAKEARGEAVRGPCVITSRLNLLAQPKRSYVQAHDEQRQSKGRQNFIPERPQRPIHNLKATSQEKNSIVSPNIRNRQKRLEAVHELKRPPNVRPIDHVEKAVQPASSGLEMRRSEVSAIKHRYMQESEIMNKKMAIFNALNRDNGRSPSPPDVRKVSNRRAKPFNPENIETVLGTATKQSEDTQPISALNEVVKSLLKYKAFQLENVSECSEPCHVISEDTTSSLEVASKNGSSVFDVDVFGDINVVTAIECNNSSDTLSSNKEPKVLKPEKNIQSLHEFPFENNVEGSACFDYKNGYFPYDLAKKEFAPKSILRKSLMMQSNDACSLFVNPSFSHHVKITTSKSDDASGLREMSVLSKSKLGWAVPTIPVQIATVGFAFPQYNFMTNPLNRTLSLAKIKYNDVTPEDEDTQKRIVKFDKTSQCYKEPSQSVLHNIYKSNSNIIIAVESENAEYFEKTVNKSNVPRTYIVNSFDEMLQINQQPCVGNSDENRTDVKIVASDCSIIQNVKKVEKDTTSSMDMLVSVLNEIKKITTRQTHIANPFSLAKNANDEINRNTPTNKCLMPEQRNTIENPSITILKTCDKLASNSSTISDYITNCEEMVDKYDNDSLHLYDENVTMPVLLDKEVNADIKDKISVNNSDACSQCFPSVVSESTAVTQSLYGYSSDPSRASILSVDFRTISNYSLQTPKIVEIEDIETSSAAIVESKRKQADQISVFNQFILNSDKVELLNLKEDPMMKMKRDILVTVYSFLVFTVFAALSFPEVLYRI